MKCLFLYTEIAGYTEACLTALSAKVDEILLIRWPVNNEAPFTFNLPENVHTYVRTSFTDEALLKKVLDFNPQITFVSGWIDKGYLKIAKTLKKTNPVVVGFDNQWTGGLKQRLAGWLSPFLIKKYFTHAWIPGEPQYKFARKLGFSKKHILQGVYAADTALFEQYESEIRQQKQVEKPLRFLYVGRYVEWKGVKEMWSAFESIEDKKGWEFWCAGTGELYDQKPEIDGLKHLGFLQPESLSKVIEQTTVFILPSKFEPWAVTIQEYAAAGFPIVCSSAVGASTAFLEHNKNGWLLPEVTTNTIQTVMKQIIAEPYERLQEMGQLSMQKAKLNSPEIWANKLINIIKA